MDGNNIDYLSNNLNIQFFIDKFNDFQNRGYSKETKKLISNFSSFFENSLKRHSLENIINNTETENKICGFLLSNLKYLLADYIEKYRCSFHNIIDLNKGFLKFDFQKAFNEIKLIKQ